MNADKQQLILFVPFTIAFVKSLFLFSGAFLPFEIILSLNILELIFIFFYMRHVYIELSAKIVLISIIFSCFLYSTTPVAFYIFAPKFAIFFNNTLFYSSLFNSTFFSGFYFWLLYLFGIKRVEYFQRDFDILTERFDVNIVRTVGVTLFGFALLIIYINNFYNSGASAAILNSSRFEVTKTVETGRIWLIQYAMAAYCIWLICFSLIRHDRRPPLFFVFLSINCFIFLFYLYFYFQLGNRREALIPILFFIMFRYIKNNRADFVLILGALAAMTWIGISRVTSVATTTFALEDSLFAGLGEFLLTSFPLNLYIESGEVSLRYGATIIQSVLAGTPLIDAGLKPLSLANEFVEIFSRSGIGYGFSPMAESYLNFGFLGAVIGPILLAFTISFVSKFPLPHKGFALLVLASLSLDIFRGESGSMFWQFVVIYGILCLLCVRWQPNTTRRQINNNVPSRDLLSGT